MPSSENPVSTLSFSLLDLGLLSPFQYFSFVANMQNGFLSLKDKNSRCISRFQIYFVAGKITVGLERLALRFFCTGCLPIES